MLKKLSHNNWETDPTIKPLLDCYRKNQKIQQTINNYLKTQSKLYLIKSCHLSQSTLFIYIENSQVLHFLRLKTDQLLNIVEPIENIDEIKFRMI